MKILMVTLVVALFSATAWADSAPIDPTIVLKKGGGSPTTQWGFDKFHPIYIALGSVNDFKLTWSGSALYVEVAPAVIDFGTPAQITDQSVIDAFENLTFSCVIDPSLGSGCTFYPYAKGLNDNNNSESGTYVPGSEAVFTGTFTAGEDLQLAVPEPSTLALLLFGVLGAAFYFSKRRNALLA